MSIFLPALIIVIYILFLNSLFCIFVFSYFDEAVYFSGIFSFLIKHYFSFFQEFSYWFSNPLSSMVEGNRGINNDLISRLHSIMRPFLLRRLKKDVEKQMPGKFEHIVMCKLSRRQQFLYEEFMSRSSTRSLLSGANYMGMMNILMQLRKVRKENNGRIIDFLTPLLASPNSEVPSPSSLLSFCLLLSRLVSLTCLFCLSF